MWKQLSLSPLVLLAALCPLQLVQGKLAGSQLFPSCTGNTFPNFSYARGVFATEGSFPCNSVNTQYPSPPLTITWFYYATYPPADCDNSAESAEGGDQCCHSTATSTVTFTNTTFVNSGLGVVGTSTGSVTAGAFAGQAATFVLTLPSVASANLNCNKAYGQEARVGTVSLTIDAGPNCQNGAHREESCPGFY